MKSIFAIAVVVSLSLNGMIAYGIHDKNDMINELIKTGKFTEDEAKDFISKTMPFGNHSDNNKNGQDNNKVNNNGQIDNKTLLSNGYNVKHLQGQNITKLLNNHIYGVDHLEITCTGVAWMNQTSTSCSVLNLAKMNEEFYKLSNDVDHARYEYLKNLTR
jgi:polyhydroxyalkanoate synthesis regulator phasin